MSELHKFDKERHMTVLTEALTSAAANEGIHAIPDRTIDTAGRLAMHAAASTAERLGFDGGGAMAELQAAFQDDAPDLAITLARTCVKVSDPHGNEDEHTYIEH
jgi:hypothetical protein